MNEFAERLKNMKDFWEQGKAEPDRIPEGIYTMQVQNAELTESQSSGRMQIHREHLVLDGEFHGEVVHDYMQLETERGPRFIQRWIENIGFEIPDAPEQLEEALAEIASVAPVCKMKVKHSGEYTNLWFVKLVELDINKTTQVAPISVSEPESKPNPIMNRTPKAVQRNAEEILKAFAKSQNLTVKENASGEEIKEEIMKYDWRREELVPEEVSLLEEIGADFVD